MPRVARAVRAGWPLHIVQRGINRQPCFFEDTDYEIYLRNLCLFSERFACAVHAYCLMTNHVHLLLTPQEPDSCARLMKQVGQSHVQRINDRLGRTGTLWEGRFRSCLVHSDRYVLACYRYIELNPVRAGMVRLPEHYRWSSYAINASGRSDRLLTPHSAYEALDSRDTERGVAYRQLCEIAVTEPVIEEIRKATRIGCAMGVARRGKGRPSGQMRKMGSVPIFET